MRTRPQPAYVRPRDRRPDTSQLPLTSFSGALPSSGFSVLIQSVERCIRFDSEREMLPLINSRALMEWLHNQATVMYEPAGRKRRA